ncbi:MAG: polysaccharide deacetylase family protein [Gammaproteobacteria bacterium]|nr:polysaccharide deacetylase family protein [Gammaproteobacteria bacterium]
MANHPNARTLYHTLAACLLLLFYSALFAAAETVITVPDHAVILQYHHFSQTTPRIASVTPEEFAEHLAYLDKHQFQVLPLAEILGKLQNGETLPDKVIAITIDNPSNTIYSEAWPRLKARHWPATVFVNTLAIGGQNSLSWEMLREMQQEGITFANHSSSHHHLHQRLPNEDLVAWRQRVTIDIQTAQQQLQQQLGSAPPWFAYPYGEYNDDLMQLISELGYIGFGQHSGAIGRQSNFLALPRFPVSGQYADLQELGDKLLALPLPVIDENPRSPELAKEMTHARLQLTLGEGSFNPETLNCFVSGQGQPLLEIDGNQLTIEAKAPLPVGRSRYNCTALHQQQTRYYWYSHPWLRRNPDGNWHNE